MRITAHICTRDRPKELYGLLISLYCQTFKEWDLIIVDESDTNLAHDKTLRDAITRIKLDGHGVKVIRHEPDKRQGICHARNLAIKNDNWNEVFIRIDDDSICESNYFELLVGNYTKLKESGIRVGAVGGTVPLWGEPEIIRMVSHVKPIFNKITYSENNGTGRFNVADDGGVSYDCDENTVIESHHLRSSFLFSKEAAYAAGLHSDELGSPHSGFREETDFCMKMKLNGYKLFTVPAAKAWHLASTSGGTRNAQSAEIYAQSVAMNEDYFQRKWNRLKRLGKIPKEFCEGI